MWLLKNENDGRLIYVRPGITETIGRKGDILLLQDESISRIHAKITNTPALDLEKIIEKSEPYSTCIIKDAASKYGSFILKDGSEERITKEGYKLKDIDKIRFGLQNNIFTVHYIPMITATSGMTDKAKTKLEKILDQIDAKIVYDWCSLATHMTVETPTISEKLTCAVACLKPVVPVDYWEAVLEAFKENKELPDPVDFANSVDEKLRSCKATVRPKPARKTLFNNLIFLHFNRKQYSLFARLIKLAGGRSVLYGKQRSMPDVSNDNVIVVQFLETDTTQASTVGNSHYEDICEQLRQHRRRPIPDSEIPLAILMCSIDRYCNPKFDYSTLFASRTTPLTTLKNAPVLALDTQDVDVPTATSRSPFKKPPSGAEKKTGQWDCVPESNVDSCDIEIPQAQSTCKDSPNESPIEFESNEYRSKELSSPDSASCSVMDDKSSQYQMGSMKLASLNYENYLEDEFNKKPGAESIISKLDSEIEDMVEEEPEEPKEISRGRMENMEEDCGFEEKMSLKREIVDVQTGNWKKSKPPDSDKSDDSCEDVFRDDDDRIVDEESKVKNIFSKEQRKKVRASDLSSENEQADIDSSNRHHHDKNTHNTDTSSEWISCPSRNVNYNQTSFMFGMAAKKSFMDSAADDKRSAKRKVVSPPSEDVRNSRKRPKSLVANDEQEEKFLPEETSSKKRGLLDFPSTSKHRKNASKADETNSTVDTSMIPVLSEEELKNLSNETICGPGYEISAVFQRYEHREPTLVPLLRIRNVSDIYSEDGQSRFAKRHKKRNVRIPSRVELDGYYSNTSEYIVPIKKNVSLKEEDDEKEVSFDIVSPDGSSKVKKRFRL